MTMVTVSQLSEDVWIDKEFTETQLILLEVFIAVESHLEMKYNWNSGCYNFELHGSKLSVNFYIAPLISFHPCTRLFSALLIEGLGV